MINRVKWNILFRVITMAPVRMGRIFMHFSFPFRKKEKFPYAKSPFVWVMDLLFQLLDLIGVGEVFTFCIIIFLPTVRKLSNEEIVLAQSIFGANIKLNDVWINNKARIGTSKYAHAYVLFNIINTSGPLRSDIFIHELVHIYQYQNYGSLYIGRALQAQASIEGYNYGKGNGLLKAMVEGKHFFEFNFEQQGQILQDYYRQQRGEIYLSPIEKSAYNYYVLQLLDKNRNVA